MKIMKILLFSLSLIYSALLSPSAPANQISVNTEVPDSSYEKYQQIITAQTDYFKKTMEKFPEIEALHETMSQCIQREIQAQQFKKLLLERKKNGAESAELNLLRNQLSNLVGETQALNEKINTIVEKNDPEFSLNFFIRWRNIYFSKACYLQGVVKEKDKQIKQQAAQIQSLVAQLAQLQQLGSPQVEGLPNAPGGVIAIAHNKLRRNSL